MSDAWIAFFGVFVGAVVASIAQVALLYWNHKKWKIEKKVEYLKEKRDTFKRDFEKALEQVAEGMTADDEFSINLLVDMFCSFPKPVVAAFDEMIDEPNKDIKSLRKHYGYINLAMKEYLVEIDKEIERLLS